MKHGWKFKKKLKLIYPKSHFNSDKNRIKTIFICKASSSMHSCVHDIIRPQIFGNLCCTFMSTALAELTGAPGGCNNFRGTCIQPTVTSWGRGEPVRWFESLSRFEVRWISLPGRPSRLCTTDVTWFFLWFCSPRHWSHDPLRVKFNPCFFLMIFTSSNGTICIRSGSSPARSGLAYLYN